MTEQTEPFEQEPAEEYKINIPVASQGPDMSSVQDRKSVV